MTGLKIPRDDEEDIQEDIQSIETLTENEINKLINSLGHVKLRYIVRFALLTGARMGEILALDKSDIYDDMVRINKSVRNVKVFEDEDNYSYELKVTQPKTKSSNREVPLPKVLVKELARLDILVKEEKLKLGPMHILTIIYYSLLLLVPIWMLRT